MVTLEAAIALTALVSIFVVCLAGVVGVVAQIRCIDAAREAALLAARGDERAVVMAEKIAPSGAVVLIRDEGLLVVATVTVGLTLPPISLSAESRAIKEEAFISR